MEFEPIMEDQDIQLSRGNFNLMASQSTQGSQSIQDSQPGGDDVVEVRTISHTVPKVLLQ